MQIFSFFLFIPLFQKFYRGGIFLSMNFNLKKTVERSKRRSYFLSLVFITRCCTKNLLLRTLVVESKSNTRVRHSVIIKKESSRSLFVLVSHM